MHLGNVSGLEPLPPKLVEKVLIGLVRQLVIPGRNAFPANDYLSPGIRFVRHSVPSLFPVDQSYVAGCSRRAHSARASVVGWDEN